MAAGARVNASEITSDTRAKFAGTSGVVGKEVFGFTRDEVDALVVFIREVKAAGSLISPDKKDSMILIRALRRSPLRRCLGSKEEDYYIAVILPPIN
jgi:hypothetical protein